MTDINNNIKATILVVDDGPENIELLSSILRQDYRVLAATGGQRALELARGNTKPDLILLDISMPDMDGYAVCRALKAEPATAAIPVLFVSAKDRDEDEVTGLNLGAADYLTKPIKPALVKARVATHLSLYDQSRHLQSLVEERTRELAESNSALAEEMRHRDIALKRVHELKDFDQLTGLPNRSCFFSHLATAIDEASDGRERIGVVCLDVARFSQINSSYGHDAANRILQALADRFSDSLDSREIIGRIGGDSFALLIREEGALQAVSGLGTRADAVMDACRENLPLPDDAITLDLFAGIAVWPEDAQEADELLRHSEAALKHSVSQGAGLACFSPQMKEKAHENVLLESRLRRAIEMDTLIPYFQPQISIQGRKPCGAEALLRWPDGEGGFISPGLFIPLAENLGLIEDIGRLVQHKCFIQLREWQDRLPGDFTMAINLSAREFASERIVEQLSEFAADAGCNTRQIELEVTEHALIHDRSSAIEKLKSLRSLGFRLSLDDFGTGYSSLSYVKDFPLDKLKIDQSFIRDMLAGPRERAIVETVINLARNMEMTSVAEGVETEEHVLALAEQGCRIAQGYLYSPAIPPAKFEAWWQAF